MDQRPRWQGPAEVKFLRRLILCRLGWHKWVYTYFVGWNSVEGAEYQKELCSVCEREASENWIQF